MTEKRFEYNHEKGYKDYIYDVMDNRMMWDLKCICELLNSLNDENEQLRQLFDEADDIILSQCTSYYQRQWENIKKNIKGDV